MHSQNQNRNQTVPIQKFQKLKEKTVIKGSNISGNDTEFNQFMQVASLALTKKYEQCINWVFKHIARTESPLISMLTRDKTD